jgi:hypothetical protein
MRQIRAYKEADYPMIRQWWESQGELAPTPSMLPLDSTWIVELYGIPALCVSLILTNTSFCYVENFVGNPEVKGKMRFEASHWLNQYIAKVARARGYSSMLCMAHKDPLRKRYRELGYRETLNGVSTFVMETK